MNDEPKTLGEFSLTLSKKLWPYVFEGKDLEISDIMNLMQLTGFMIGLMDPDDKEEFSMRDGIGTIAEINVKPVEYVDETPEESWERDKMIYCMTFLSHAGLMLSGSIPLNRNEWVALSRWASNMGYWKHRRVNHELRHHPQPVPKVRKSENFWALAPMHCFSDNN